MNNLPHADIFFFVSTVLLSLLTIIFIVALIYLIKLLREARSIVKLVRAEAELLAGDIGAVREKIREHASNLSWGKLLLLASGFLKKKKKRRN
jgi:hypothetical protein